MSASLRLLLAFVLAACMEVRAAAPREGLKLDKSRWREATSGISYVETFESGKQQSEEAATPEQPAPKLDSMKYLYYGLILGAILFFISRFLRSGDQNKKIEQPAAAEVETVEDAEERLPDADLEGLLQRALDARDYRLAMRVKFLMLIRLLSEKGKIAWAKEKTNWEYYREIRERLLADRFGEIIMSFERSWYGDKPVDERDYNDSLPRYSAITEMTGT